MEHPCYRCQALIDEGITFCPHCGAPQIRVVAPEGDTPPASPNSAGEFPPSTQPYTPPQSWPQGGMMYPAAGNAIQWELAWRGALLSGLGAAILTAVPIISFGCCLWLLGAGALSVHLYQRRAAGTRVTPGMGMRVGALAGVFAFVIHALVTVGSFVIFRSNEEFRRTLQEQMEKSMASNPDPKVQEMMQRMMGWISSPQGMATFIVMLLVAMAIIFVLFTAAGGALGASLLAKRRELR